MRYGAELVITGKAETSFDAEKTFYGVVNYEFASKGTARLIITDTGELIAVVSKTAKKSATGMSSAVNLSLQVLGGSIAEELLAKTTTKLAAMNAGPKIVQVAVVGIDNLVVLDYETRLVREVPIIKALKIRYLESNVRNNICRCFRAVTDSDCSHTLPSVVARTSGPNAVITPPEAAGFV